MIFGTTESSALFSILCTGGVLASGWDAVRHRIPNWLTLSVCVLALATRGSFSTGGLVSDGLVQGAVGVLAGIALYLVPFALRWLGGGDVKLLAAFGAIGGPGFALHVGLVAIFLGALWAIARSLLSGKRSEIWERWKLRFFLLTQLKGKELQAVVPTAEEGHPIAFAIPLTLGAIGVWLIERGAGA